MQDYAYLFEAKGIGEYITDTGRLIDLIGGSDLVAGLCSSDGDDLLTEVLVAAEAAGIAESRRAGGAFCLHDEGRDRLDRVRALWRLVVGLSCPGLSFTDSDPMSGGEDSGGAPAVAALAAAYRQQPGLRENTPALLPPTGQPVTEISRRTGRVATMRASPGRRGRDEDRLDGVVAAQRARGERIARSASEDRLARLFLPAEARDGPRFRFPRHFEAEDASPDNPAFPFRGGDRRLGVVHADISGLGQVFRKVTRRAREPSEVRGAARCIEEAVARAARGASEAVLLNHAVEAGELAVVPARPVILGGDDITIIVRADLAVAFACELLERIEQETRAAFPEHASLGLPAHLSACAGVAVVGAGHPFLAANRMAEGMCRHAKDWAKRAVPTGNTPPSALTFGVITSTVDEPYDAWREREQRLLAPVGEADPDEGAQDGLFATACPYRAGGEEGRSVQSLLALAALLECVEGRGKVMEATALRPTDTEQAGKLYGRFRDVLGADDAVLLERMDGILNGELGLAPEDFDAVVPFLNDAMELIDIGATTIAEGEA